MATLIHLLVRWLHVLGVTLLLGGAVAAWGILRLLPHDRRANDISVTLAVGYEWLFWTAFGVLVVTGVGNLGALAPSVPSLDSPWGTAFALKLLAVAGLLLGSLVRTLVVTDRRTRDADATVRPLLRRSYGATALYLVGLLFVAEVLAHG